MNQNETELMHYGVLGMKWGHRKNRYISKDSKRVTNIRKKRIDQMSNQELKEVNKRLELENNYKNFSSKQKVGKQVVKTFIGVAGTIAAIEGAAKTYKRVGDFAVNKIGKKVIK